MVLEVEVAMKLCRIVVIMLVRRKNYTSLLDVKKR
jgi:hypothetical protein